MSHIFQKTMKLLLGSEESLPLEDRQVRPVAKQEPKKSIKKPQQSSRKMITERELIQLESEIGAQLFGEIPEGHRREFFNLDQNTWIWHDEIIEPSLKRHHEKVTVRYEIHANGILKVQEGARYTFIEGEELKNFVMATQLYYERICRHIYHQEPQAALVGSQA